MLLDHSAVSAPDDQPVGREKELLRGATSERSYLTDPQPPTQARFVLVSLLRCA